MEPFRRLLVDVDALAADHPALVQALNLAEHCGARVKIVDVLPDVPRLARRFVTRTIEQELLQDRRKLLEAIAHGHAPRVPKSVAVLRGKPATALVDEVLRGRHDLIARAHQRDLSPEPKPFGPIDMRLLRECPCPVWLVGPRPFEGPPRILACVDVAAPDPDHQVLNRSIVELAMMMRELHDGTLTLVHAWFPFGESLLRSRLQPDEFEEFVSGTRATAAAGMDAVLRPLGPRAEGLEIELLRGEPEDVIPAFAQHCRADLVVMGTVGRSGVAGAVIGNTAEKVLQRLRGSVLAIKPPSVVARLGQRRRAAARRPRRSSR